MVEALEEVGIDVSGRTPRALEQADVEWADLVVTMGCGDACPVLPGKEYLDWNLPDPAGLCLEEVRELRGVIEQRVSTSRCDQDDAGEHEDDPGVLCPLHPLPEQRRASSTVTTG